VFFLANRSDGAFDLIDSLPAEVFGTSSAFRITCNSLNELNTAVLCLLSSRSAGSAQSKAFDAVVYSGQSNTDIEGLDASVNFLIEESRLARGARGASLAEDDDGNVEWSLKTILTGDQIGKVKCDECCRLDACCIWSSNQKSCQPWYVYLVLSSFIFILCMFTHVSDLFTF